MQSEIPQVKSLYIYYMVSKLKYIKHLNHSDIYAAMNN